ncbi:hypothetical protein JTB14_021831 [Gonioctena quinquepunctata]|nr:hypothetical protein JTB14_021831 [Gonioctena quinquepunctata]
MGMLYDMSPGLKITGFSDADYGGDADNRHSTTGYMFHFGSGAISWNSKRQSTLALFTTESEYIAASTAVKDLIWLDRLHRNILIGDTSSCTLYINNQTAIKLIKNQDFHKRTKHVDIKYHFIRGKVSPEVDGYQVYWMQ